MPTWKWTGWYKKGEERKSTELTLTVRYKRIATEQIKERKAQLKGEGWELDHEWLRRR